MTLDERNQVAKILRSHIAREYPTQKDYYEGLVEHWRKVGHVEGIGSIDEGAFRGLVAEALYTY